MFHSYLMGEETVCTEVLSYEVEGDGNISRNELNRDHPYIDADDADTQPDTLPSKKVKELWNDDIRSEVLNPKVSPKENASISQDITSHSSEAEYVNQEQCGELSSTCLENSCYEEALSDGEGNPDSITAYEDNSIVRDDVMTSRIELEIPKHASSTGIRKIIFKFSKKKQEYENQPPVPENQTPAIGIAYGACGIEEEDNYNESSDICNSKLGFEYQCEMEYSGARNTSREKVVANCYPTNVKKLLSTGILDGARVKYISSSGDVELCGIIEGGGYLCGCWTCNYSRVRSAYEFEQHAGAKTGHPNNHIYLENGRPIYKIIHDMKTAPIGILDEVLKDVAGSSLNEHAFQVWKASIKYRNQKVVEDRYYDHNLPVPCSLMSQASKSVYTLPNSYPSHNPVEQPIFLMRKTEEWKRPVKRPSPYISSLFVQQKRTIDGYPKRRDNDLHRLLFMPNGLPDGAELAYYVKGHLLLGGYKQGNGIMCSCCNIEVSPSQFEAHAGMAARRQPYRHIYTSNGLTLHDIALSLANGQNIAIGDTDDRYVVCGDGGDLAPCNACSRAFHLACLDLQHVPDGTWLCINCRYKATSGREAATRKFSGTGRRQSSRVVKASKHEIGGCVVCRENDFSVTKFDERTIIICEQCEKEYHVGCLQASGRCVLNELPWEKWFCCDDCSFIHDALQNSTANGAEVIPASLSSLISKKHLQRGLGLDVSTGIEWRILNGKSRYPGHLPILSRAAAIFRECFDPIVAKSGRDLIPVMVYGRNISGQEFGGMFCIVLLVKSMVVSAGLLRIFGREVAELPLIATCREHQGKGYFQVLYSCVERLLFSLNVENLVLPSAEDAEPIWTQKLGFKKMGEEQLSRYLKEVQLTMFKGTSMLEKAVQMRAY